MSPTTLLVVYSLAILVVSLAGGVAPLVLRLTHRRLELAVSFVAGVMLGVAMLHMLPHAIVEAQHAGSLQGVMIMTLVGLVVMFLVERFLSFHHHDPPGGGPVRSVHSHTEHSHSRDPRAERQESIADSRPDRAAGGGALETDVRQRHPDDAEHVEIGASEDDSRSSHDLRPSPHVSDAPLPSPPLPSPAEQTPSHPDVTWGGAAVGLSIHSVISGVALAASVEAQAHLSAEAWAGWTTFLVIFLHKPFDSLTLGALMARGGWPILWRHVVNGLFALLIPLGVALFILGVRPESLESSPAVAYALAFSAGTFLCIALSDLLPELQFHAHDRGKLSIALLLGLAVALAASQFEGHEHHEEVWRDRPLPPGEGWGEGAFERGFALTLPSSFGRGF